MDPHAEITEQLARLVVELGANVQPGQVVALSSEPGLEPLARAVATAAYRRGAKFVDLTVFDLHLKRARALFAAEDTLDWVPPWYGERVLALGENRAARINLHGPVAPGLMDDVDPARLGRDLLPSVPESTVVLNQRTTNWSIIPAPNTPWARLVHPELPDGAALNRLWAQIAHVCRLDEPDPDAAWAARLDELVAVAGRLTERRFEAIRFRGEGTDLRIGLLPSSTWIGARMTTVDGIEHIPNLPTEEVFTTPDPLRVDGQVRATKPLYVAGTLVEGLRMRFDGGRAVEIDADSGAEVIRGIAARDEGAARLGEVALVDGSGRIGALDTVFYTTLLDENAASHVALGQAYGACVADATDRERMNASEIHVDFMIGSPEVTVSGLAADGGETVMLAGGRWQLT